MKKNTFFTRLFYYSIVLSATFLSCQKDELDSEAKELSSVFSSALRLNSEMVLLDYGDCNTVCLEEGSETYYKIADTKTLSNGGGSNINTKLVSYEAYNTETQFIVNVFYDITSGNSNSKADITVNINGDILALEEIAKGSTVSHSINLSKNWEACDIINFSILQEGLGPNIAFNQNYALIGMCESGCEERFSYELNEDGSYTFSYVSAEDMEGAVVKFTSPHLAAFEALDGKIYSVNPGKGNGSPTVLTWPGDITACEEITFILSFEADCDQNNGGFANVFTDFKVNDISKKGDNTNIRVVCSE